MPMQSLSFDAIKCSISISMDTKCETFIPFQLAFGYGEIYKNENVKRKKIKKILYSIHSQLIER